MNNDTTLQQLRGALLALYSPDVPVSVRNEADAFLQAFLFSRDCWSISLTLIRSSDAAFFEQLFAARALHQRLRCLLQTAQTALAVMCPRNVHLFPRL